MLAVSVAALYCKMNLWYLIARLKRHFITAAGKCAKQREKSQKLYGINGKKYNNSQKEKKQMVNHYDYDYSVAQEIATDRRYGFGPCLLAAIGQADEINRIRLRDAFPDAYEAFIKNNRIELRTKVQDWKEEKKLVKGTCREEY
jgi:hypothetical protein